MADPRLRSDNAPLFDHRGNPSLVEPKPIDPQHPRRAACAKRATERDLRREYGVKLERANPFVPSIRVEVHTLRAHIACGADRTDLPGWSENREFDLEWKPLLPATFNLRGHRFGVGPRLMRLEAALHGLTELWDVREPLVPAQGPVIRSRGFSGWRRSREPRSCAPTKSGTLGVSHRRAAHTCASSQIVCETAPGLQLSDSRTRFTRAARLGL